MLTDFVDRQDWAHEHRLTAHAYQVAWGSPPAGIWYVPGTVTLLADGERRLVVAARWGSIVAAAPRSDGVVEPLRMTTPDERVTLTVDEAAAGQGPSWAREGLRAARCGASLLASTDLPEGSGLGSAAATQTAIRFTLHDLAALNGGDEPAQPAAAGTGDAAGRPAGGTAMLDGRPVPFDLAAAGLRLVIIDTRARGAAQLVPAEHAPMDEAKAAVDAGALSELGPMLTAVHAGLAPDEAQRAAVSAAIDGGALGARMITDGPGRPVCALVPWSALPTVRAAVSREFARRALRAPRVITVTPVNYAPGRVA